MSSEHLEAGDIVVAGGRIGLVMRHDEDSGLLIALPGMDELLVMHVSELKWRGNLEWWASAP